MRSVEPNPNGARISGTKSFQKMDDRAVKLCNIKYLSVQAETMLSKMGLTKTLALSVLQEVDRGGGAPQQQLRHIFL